MKKNLLILGGIILITAFNSTKEKQFLPPGTVQINDSLFADECEISNLSWREFVNYNKQEFGSNSVEYKSSLPDTLVWRQKLTYNEPYTEYYHVHPAYNEYPVVGISYEQAVNFCKWRTDRVHIMLEIKEGKRRIEDSNEPYTGINKFEYRLPTKIEWEALALVGNDFKQKEKYAKTKSAFFNIKDETTNSKVGGADVTAPVKSYLPTKLGLYNVIGNVSEMVAEKGVSKGGSWRDGKDYASVWKDAYYDTPNSWTGFRCVCVLKRVGI